MNGEILKDLKGNNNSAYGHLYKEYFPVVNRFVLNNNGQPGDSEDLFQDTMLVLVEKLRQDNFYLTASLKTYIMAIAKNIWLKSLRNKSYILEFTENQNNTFFQNITLAIEEEKTYRDKLLHFLHKITKHCQGLIHDMFYRGKSIEQVKHKYNYSTIHNAQNQKHKCVEQIRKIKQEAEKKV